MTNKMLLQIISGFLALFSFFSSWIIAGAYSMTPSEILGTSKDAFPLQFLWVGLPIIGLYNIYLGYMKKTNVKANWINIALGCYLLLAAKIAEMGPNYNHLIDGLLSGYFMCLFSVIASVAMIFITEKPFREEQKNQNL